VPMAWRNMQTMLERLGVKRKPEEEIINSFL